MAGALSGLRVLDFSSLLPGPLATLMLADAGAEVIKIERPEGELGRSDRAIFAILNRGKRSIAIDLKADGPMLLRPLLESADVVVEQFRPGVMDRLGLGYDAVRRINPRVVYVSISGYGQAGPNAQKAGHDLTYSAEAGLLSLNADATGAPVVPATMAADIVGGSYPAVINILMALYRRQVTGEGAFIDVSMFAGLAPVLCEPIAHAFGEGRAPRPGYSPATGGSARYRIYRTADGEHLACAPAEEKFWRAFCEAVELDPATTDPEVVGARLATRPAAEWEALFKGRDVCCQRVLNVTEALESPALRGLFDRQTRYEGLVIPALPTAVSVSFRDPSAADEAPPLGANNDLLGRSL